MMNIHKVVNVFYMLEGMLIMLLQFMFKMVHPNGNFIIFVEII